MRNSRNEPHLLPQLIIALAINLAAAAIAYYAYLYGFFGH
jgi:hypothetical protein